MLEKLTADGKCPYGNDAKEEHTCPYEAYVNDDEEFKCVCCDECMTDCVRDTW